MNYKIIGFTTGIQSAESAFFLIILANLWIKWSSERTLCPTAEGCPWHCAAHHVPHWHPLLGTSLQIPTGPFQSPACESPSLPVWARADLWPSLSATWFSLIAGWMIASSGKWFTPPKAPSIQGAYPLLCCREKKYCDRAPKIIKLSDYLHTEYLKVRIVVVKKAYDSFFPW